MPKSLSFAAAWLALVLTSCTTAGLSVDIPLGAADTDKSVGRAADTFRFVVVGDRTGGARPGVFAQTIAAAESLKPDFVLSVGDYIEGYTEDAGALDLEWQEIEDRLAPLSSRFFLMPGNHDISNTAMAKDWSTRWGDSYYHFVVNDVLFLVLNTEDPFVQLSPDVLARKKQFDQAFAADPMGTQARVLEAVAGRPSAARLPGSVNISDAQVAWATQILAQHANAKWTFVLLHKPAWTYDSAAFAEIEAALGDRPFTVIAGHEHYYDHERRNGRDYITMGTSGGVWLREGAGRADHLLFVTVEGGTPSLVNMRLDGIGGVGAVPPGQTPVTSRPAE